MKKVSLVLVVLAVITLLMIGSVCTLAKPLSTPKPAVPNAQDAKLAEAISNAYNTNVTANEISNLRINNKLGYGEIALLYGLTFSSQKSMDTILALREQGDGWGDIARALGLKVSDIMSKTASVLKTAKMDNENKTLKEKITKEEKEKNQSNNKPTDKNANKANKSKNGK